MPIHAYVPVPKVPDYRHLCITFVGALCSPVRYVCCKGHVVYQINFRQLRYVFISVTLEGVYAHSQTMGFGALGIGLEGEEPPML